MNENNNVEDCLVQGWAIDVEEYANYYKISLQKATKEVKKACLKMGFKCYWKVLEVEGIIPKRNWGYWFSANQDVIDNATKDGRFVHLEIERVIKKSGNGRKAKIYKTAELKQYIKEVLKPKDELHPGL